MSTNRLITAVWPSPTIYIQLPVPGTVRSVRFFFNSDERAKRIGRISAALWPYDDAFVSELAYKATKITR